MDRKGLESAQAAALRSPATLPRRITEVTCYYQSNYPTLVVADLELWQARRKITGMLFLSPTVPRPGKANGAGIGNKETVLYARSKNLQSRP
jgi:hypothetical protein